MAKESVYLQTMNQNNYVQNRFFDKLIGLNVVFYLSNSHAVRGRVEGADSYCVAVTPVDSDGNPKDESVLIFKSAIVDVIVNRHLEIEYDPHLNSQQNKQNRPVQQPKPKQKNNEPKKERPQISAELVEEKKSQPKKKMEKLHVDDYTIGKSEEEAVTDSLPDLTEMAEESKPSENKTLDAPPDMSQFLQMLKN